MIALLILVAVLSVILGWFIGSAMTSAHHEKNAIDPMLKLYAEQLNIANENWDTNVSRAMAAYDSANKMLDHIMAKEPKAISQVTKMEHPFLDGLISRPARPRGRRMPEG